VDLRYLDYLSVNSATPLHRSSAPGKLLALAGFLAALLSSPRLSGALFLLAGELVAFWATRQPVRRLAALASYPLLFAGLYALVRLPVHPQQAALVLVRAFASTLAVVTLLATTPFWELFGVLGRFLPGLVADAVLMSYRAFFVLVGRLRNLLVALRLRRLSDRFSLQTLLGYAAVLGALTMAAFDMTERQYRIMRLRGYAGPLASAAPLTLAPADAGLFLGVAALAAGAVWLRIALGW
jgi:cobalt/nickel transport system permease protein